jgi:hypothetical protein
LLDRLPRLLAVGSLAVITAVFVAHVGFAQDQSLAGKRFFEIKEPLSYIADRWRGQDLLFVHYASQYAFAYYGTCGCFRLSDGRRIRDVWPIRRQPIHDSSEQYPPVIRPTSSSLIIGLPGKEHFRAQLRRLVEHRRVWILTTWIASARERGIFERRFLGPLDQRGKRIRDVEMDGAHVYLYEFAQR